MACFIPVKSCMGIAHYFEQEFQDVYGFLFFINIKIFIFLVVRFFLFFFLYQVTAKTHCDGYGNYILLVCS